jgi:hypothetical protein
MPRGGPLPLLAVLGRPTRGYWPPPSLQRRPGHHPRLPQAGAARDARERGGRGRLRAHKGGGAAKRVAAERTEGWGPAQEGGAPRSLLAVRQRLQEQRSETWIEGGAGEPS